MPQETRDFILLIENQPSLNKLVTEALQQSRLEAELISAKDGLEAIDALYGKGIFAGKRNRYRPKLILLNLSLPILSGIEVLHVLRSEAKTWDIPIIIISGTVKEQEQLKNDTFKPNAYVLEPDVQTVEQMVKVLEETWR